MNVIRTAMLLAFMTALFMGVGYLIGGSGGMMIAFLIAAGMNFFSYWNADKMVLSMHHAVEVDERSAPEYLRHRPRPCGARRPADAEDLPDRQSAAQRLRDRPQPPECSGRRHHRAARTAEPRGGRRRHGARARACPAPRHADHDDHRDAGRRDLDARQFRILLRRQPRQQQSARLRRRAGRDDRCAAGGDAGADGDQPHPRIFRRSPRRGDLRPAAVAGVGA